MRKNQKKQINQLRNFKHQSFSFCHFAWSISFTASGHKFMLDTLLGDFTKFGEVGINMKHTCNAIHEKNWEMLIFNLSWQHFQALISFFADL